MTISLISSTESSLSRLLRTSTLTIFLLCSSESLRIAALLSSMKLQETSTFLMSGFSFRYSARCSQKRLPSRFAEKSISWSF